MLKQPTIHFTVTRAGWTVIANGSPLMATAPSIHTAYAVARKNGLSPYCLPVFDGDTGTFYEDVDAWHARAEGR